MRTPKLFLDTNLPSKLNGPYRGDVGRIMSVITDEFKIVAAPTTFCELLNRLASGDGSHFESDKEAFRLIVGKDAIEFLPMPIAFMLHARSGFSKDDSRPSPLRDGPDLSPSCEEPGGSVRNEGEYSRSRAVRIHARSLPQTTRTGTNSTSELARNRPGWQGEPPAARALGEGLRPYAG